MEDSDAQLQLKKRARRRLIGAVFFVSIVALILPLAMDQEPRQAVQDVEIRIPGQDDKAFAPKFSAAPAEKPAPEKSAEGVTKPAEPAPTAPQATAATGESAKPTARVIETNRNGDKPAASKSEALKPAVEKPEVVKPKPEKAGEKPLEKPVEKPVNKSAEKQKADEAKRAAAILSGQPLEAAKPAPAAKTGGDHLILIGAFNNEENVKILKTKLGELGIKVFTESLETPQGRKTRVRAGPFPSREAADKALEKMKKIGVSGVVAAKP